MLLALSVLMIANPVGDMAAPTRRRCRISQTGIPKLSRALSAMFSLNPRVPCRKTRTPIGSHVEHQDRYA